MSEQMVTIIGLFVLIIFPSYSGYIAKRRGFSFVGTFILHLIIIFAAFQLEYSYILRIVGNHLFAQGIVSTFYLLALFLPPLVIALNYKHKDSETSKTESAEIKQDESEINIADFSELKNRYNKMSTENLQNLLKEGGLRVEAMKAIAEVLGDRAE
jgi:predicted membrane protein